MPTLTDSAMVPIGMVSSESSVAQIPSRGLWTADSGLQNTLRVIRKYRRSLMLCVIGALGAAVLVSLVTHPVYQASVLIEVLPEGAGDAGSEVLQGAVSQLIGGDQLKPEVETQVQVLKDRAVALDVITKLDLRTHDPFRPVGGLFTKEHIYAERGLSLDNAPYTREELLKRFARQLSVEPIPNTRLIMATISNTNSPDAAAIANELIKSLIANHLQVRYYAMQDTSKWITEQMSGMKANVDESQRTLGAFESTHGLFGAAASMGSPGLRGNSGSATIADVGGGLHSPVLDKYAVLNQELTTAEATRIAKEAIYRLTLTQNAEVVIGLPSSPLGMSGGGIDGANGPSIALLQTLRAQEATVKMQLADAATKYGPNNPKLAQLEHQVTALTSQMTAEMGRISDRARNDFELAKTNQEEIRKAYNAQKTDAIRVNDNAIKAQVLAQEANANREIYEQLYARLQEAKISVGLHGTNINILDPAMPPARATWPNWPLNLALGPFIGLGLGLGAAFCREALNDRVTTSAEVEALVNVPVFGAIPVFDRKASRPFGSQHRKDLALAPRTMETVASPNVAWVLTDGSSMVSEAYRSLRTALLLSRPNSSIKAIAVTSPDSGDGKSTTCYNLALALAQNALRVLVIDADMRRPQMHRLMGLPATPGLSNLLATGMEETEVVQTHPVLPTLSLIAAGDIPPAPAELLGSIAFKTLLDKARARFDFVLIDCPPALVVTDATLVSSQVDTVMIVVRSAVTRRRTLQHTVELLHRHCRTTYQGLVLNAVDTRSADYYYTYGYYGTSPYLNDSHNANKN